MVGVSLNNQNKADDKEQLVETNNSDVFVTVLVSFVIKLFGKYIDFLISQLKVNKMKFRYHK